MVKQCFICKKNIVGKSRGIICSSTCKKSFHVRCVKLSDDFVGMVESGSADWKYSECSSTGNESIIVPEEDNDLVFLIPSKNHEKPSTDLLSSIDLTNCTMEKF